MKNSFGCIRLPRWVSLAAAIALAAITVELAISPAYRFYQSQGLELMQLSDETARLRAIKESLPGRRLKLASGQKNFQAAGLAFHGVSANAAGATLEHALVDILKSNQLQIRQSRIQQDDQPGRPAAVRVSVSFPASHEALLSVLKVLPQLKPAVFIDSLSIQQEARVSAALNRTAGQSSDAGPYRNDPILSIELVIRGLVEPADEKE